jgi:hypothetical protein
MLWAFGPQVSGFVAAQAKATTEADSFGMTKKGSGRSKHPPFLEGEVKKGTPS